MVLKLDLSERDIFNVKDLSFLKEFGEVRFLDLQKTDISSNLARFCSLVKLLPKLKRLTIDDCFESIINTECTRIEFVNGRNVLYQVSSTSESRVQQV